MAECNTCGGYLSIEDKIRLSMKCDANGNVVWQGALLNQNEPEIDAYIDGLSTPLSSLELALDNALVSALKTGLGITNLSDFFDYLFLRNGETGEQALRNLVKDANHTSLRGLNPPEHIKNRGFRGDLTTSYLEIDYKPSLGDNFKQNDASHGLYFNPCRVTVGGESYYNGNLKSSSQRILIGHWASSLVTALNCSNGSAAGLTVPSEFTECIILSRSASDSYIKYRDGVASTMSATSTALSDINMFELAGNKAGVATWWNTHTIAISFCAKSMTAEQEAIIRNAFNAYVYAKNAIVEPIDVFMLNGAAVETFTNPTVNNIYTAYDALVSANPSYITKTLLGQDGYSNDIFQYHFNPGTQSKKILIITGVHGNEKGAVIQAYNFFKLLCNNAGSDPKINTLKNDIEYVIIPIVNPSGFNANTRNNGNNVDINRNFPYLWSAGYTFPGASAASEPETQIVISWLTANNDANYVFENHNDDLTTLSGYIYTRNMASEYRYRELMTALGEAWQLNDPAIPQTPGFVFGGTRIHLIDASAAIYVYSLGLPIISLETASDVNQFGYATPEAIFGPVYTRLATEKLTNLVYQTNLIMNTP